MSNNYQVFFRTSRGGRGIEYKAAKAEFFSVFDNCKIDIIKEFPGRMRMDIAIRELSIEEVSGRAELLGYTQGILIVHEESFSGEELSFQHTARWVVGWIRKGDKKLLLKEIYRQDEAKLEETYPNKRIFLIEKDGQVKAAKGRRRRRGLSSTDVKFILNIAQLQGHEVILDPFAGLGGILMECIARGFKVFASDLDALLRPGLAFVTNNQCAIADARRLPFKDNFFHAIITEPPFNTRYRQSVIDAMPELLRVLKKDGKIVLLIAQDMHKQIMDYMYSRGLQLKRDFTLQRHGKLISHGLVISNFWC